MPLINFSGLASGIDSEALIDATSEAARAQRVTPSETKISELTDENDTLDELKTLLGELQTLSLGFATLNGGIVARQAQSSDGTVLTATASTSASSGTYDLTINQLAKNATWSFNARPTSTSVAILGASESGTFEVSIGTGSNQENFSINVDDTTTWAGLVTQINSNTSNAQASLINVGTESSPEYALTLSTNNVGTEQGALSITTTGDVATYLDTTEGSGSAESTISAATDAQFTMSGIDGTITRSSNTINDLIQGVTINLEGTSTSAVTLTVTDDSAASAEVAEEFLEKLNEIIEFVNENNLIVSEDDGTETINIFGPLASTRVDDGALTGIRTSMSGASYSDNATNPTNAIRILADVGITTERDGTLKFDQEVFEQAVSDEPDSVNQIFQQVGDALGTTGGTIDQYIRFNGLIDLTVNSNESLIEDLNDRIARAEESILRQEESIRARFSRLESLISRLQSDQQALTSALAGLST